MSDPVIVRMCDLRAIKGCAKGARYFCVKHDISYATFIDQGLPAEVLEATGDHMALTLVAEARRRTEVENGGRQ